MRTMVYQRPGSLNVADNASVVIRSPMIRPAMKDRAGLQGAARTAIEAGRPVVVYSVLPEADLAQFEATLQIIRYSVQGGYEGSTFLANYPSGTLDVSGAIFQNRGVIEHDGEYDGVFETILTLTNRAGATVILKYLLSVYSKHSGDE